MVISSFVASRERHFILIQQSNFCGRSITTTVQKRVGVVVRGRSGVVVGTHCPASSISLHVAVHKEGFWGVAGLDAVHPRLLPSFPHELPAILKLSCWEVEKENHCTPLTLEITNNWLCELGTTEHHCQRSSHFMHLAEIAMEYDREQEVLLCLPPCFFPYFIGCILYSITSIPHYLCLSHSLVWINYLRHSTWHSFNIDPPKLLFTNITFIMHSSLTPLIAQVYGSKTSN